MKTFQGSHSSAFGPPINHENVAPLPPAAWEPATREWIPRISRNFSEQELGNQKNPRPFSLQLPRSMASPACRSRLTKGGMAVRSITNQSSRILNNILF